MNSIRERNNKTDQSEQRQAFQKLTKVKFSLKKERKRKARNKRKGAIFRNSQSWKYLLHERDSPVFTSYERANQLPSRIFR